MLEGLLRYPACLSTVQGVGRSGYLRRNFGSGTGTVRAEIGVPLDSTLEKLFGDFKQRPEGLPTVVERLSEALGDSRIWFRVLETNNELKAQSPDLAAVFNGVADSTPAFSGLRNRIASVHQNTTTTQANQRLASLLVGAMPFPEMVHIPDVRRAADRPLTGEELGHIARDSSLRPNGTRQKKWTETLAQILQDTFGESVQYHVPPTKNNSGIFTLSMDGDQDIDLLAVGAGVREVVAIAYKTLQAGSAKVLLLEEPENCLHPTAVRRLLRSLIDRVGLQLIVSTHSASVIDSNPNSVVQVSRGLDGSTIHTVQNTAHRFEAVRSLGHSPSELLLTPCAVWVEGPSDRIYLKSWLTTHDLTEGVDYQIMFYAGSLGSHVSVEMEPTKEQAAAIRTLSRRCVIVADSDKSFPRQHLKPHVRRWRDEIEKDPHAFLWVTAGREIENLLSLDSINAYRAIEGSTPLLEELRQFNSIFSEIKRPNKVQLANMVVGANSAPPPDAVVPVRRVAEFIRASHSRLESPRSLGEH